VEGDQPFFYHFSNSLGDALFFITMGDRPCAAHVGLGHGEGAKAQVHLEPGSM
jgi:hypothetical protein